MRFDFPLSRTAPGWAHPLLDADGQQVQMRASYLTDALGNLLQTLMSLVNGSPFASCEWTQEPGGWEWSFVRPDAVQVDLTIRFSEDVMTGEPAPFDGEVRLRTRVHLVDLIAAVAAGARRCVDESGADEFARRWAAAPFPGLELEALERWLTTKAIAPLYDSE